MVRTKKTTDRREQVKQNMRKMRARIKNDPERYEEYKRRERERYRKRQAEGKIKKINDLPDRLQRAKRKSWRESARKYRDSRRRIQDLIAADSPPPSPSSTEPEHLILPPSRQLLQGRKRSRSHRRKLNKTIKTLRERNELLEKKLKKYKSKISRLKKKTFDPDSPGKKVDLLLKHKLHNTQAIKKKILLGEVLTKQVNENVARERSIKGKRRVLQAISGELVTKYKFRNVLHSISRNLHGSAEHISNKKKYNSELQRTITQFFEKDECSRLMPGKRDTVTKSKRKKQKRFLCDSLINLHKKFISAFPKYSKLSYSEFCKKRPFWILIPDARNRETCACKQCENIALMARKLRILNIILIAFPDQLCKELCCDGVLGEHCLSRKCEHCKDRKVLFNIAQPEEIIRYKLWQTKKVKVSIKGKEKYCQRTVKELVETTAKQLVIKFLSDFSKYMTHLLNKIHQFKTIDTIKRNLKSSEVFIHMDFSENYNCKYGREIQSAHFGSSKPQISLHTVIVYVLNGGGPPMNINFCTISENLRHDPSAVCGHLTPILREIKSQNPQIKTAYFQSDGPTTQYKNKKMFYLIATYIADVLDVNQLQWHYSESGHGKGAPDGIGGSVKRKADECVAKGKDVSCFKEFHDILQEECKKIKIIAVSDEEITKYDSLVPADLTPFRGTLRVRQIFWSRSERNSLFFRSLSCLQCEGMCEHYHLGEMRFKVHGEFSNKLEDLTTKRVRYSDVYSSSSDEEVTDGQKFCKVEENFVMVQFSVKKGMKHLIGKILHSQQNAEYTISFMRRKTDKKFVFPIQEDIATVPDKDIVLFLKSPYERRGQYFFDLHQIKSIKNLA